MNPVLKNLAEALLLVPLFWGTVAFAGWLLRREQIWVDIGFLALGVGMLGFFMALIIWGLRMFHPRFEPPHYPWRVPVLAMVNIFAVAGYFTVIFSLPIWTRITIENTGSKPVTALEIGCLEELHRREVLAPKQRYRIRCVPGREGALSISWFSADKRHAVQLGHLSPDAPQKLIFRIDEQGEIRGL